MGWGWDTVSINAKQSHSGEHLVAKKAVCNPQNTFLKKMRARVNNVIDGIRWNRSLFLGICHYMGCYVLRLTAWVSLPHQHIHFQSGLLTCCDAHNISNTIPSKPFMISYPSQLKIWVSWPPIALIFADETVRWWTLFCYDIDFPWTSKSVFYEVPV